MKNIYRMLIVVAGVLVLGLAGSINASADDEGLRNLSGLVFIPGKGYSWPSMGGPVTRYYYDTAGRTHLVEVDPFTLEVRRSPVDLNKLEGYKGYILDR